jgi:hypothetical protein
MWKEDLGMTCRGQVNDIKVTLPVTHDIEPDALTAPKSPIRRQAFVFTIANIYFHAISKTYLSFPLRFGLLGGCGLWVGGLGRTIVAPTQFTYLRCLCSYQGSHVSSL